MRLSRILKMVSVVALLLLLAAPVSAQEGEGDEGDAAAGAALYAENCVVCHGEQGEGRAGASLNRVYGGINPDAFLRETIRRGVQGTYMPPWGEEYGGPLTTAEIEDIAAYIESWGTTVEPPLPAPRPPAQDIPPVPEVDGDPNAGAAVYQTNCVACHGENGEGRVGAALNVAFAGIEPDAFIIQTIRRGREGTLMPPFSEEYGGPLSEQEVQDVAAYVLSTQRPASPRPVGEVVGQASAWPLLIVLGATVLLIVAIAVTMPRGGSPPGEVDEHH